jgi:hypothetical protein
MRHGQPDKADRAGNGNSAPAKQYDQEHTACFNEHNALPKPMCQIFAQPDYI